ncbi:MAG: hypothetical protein MJA27_26060 [Pseudanabaenales cyanobacterium]|nr:hypothetical protein [Pseudanabaenales cyanobacterium]
MLSRLGKLRGLLTVSIALGLSAYIFALTIQLDIRDLPYLDKLMSAAIAIGLYFNTFEIETNLLRNQIGTVLKILLFGVPIKILLPAASLALLYFFDVPDGYWIAGLCSTVVAQIDPISTDSFLRQSGMRDESKIILRAWASLDDPITVLFAFYIFLPLALSQSFNPGDYLLNLLLTLSIWITLFIIHSNLIRNQPLQSYIEITLLTAVVLYTVASGQFLLPAVVGLFIRPTLLQRNPQISQTITSVIFYISAIVLGSLAGIVPIKWLAGLSLALPMFFMAQTIVAYVLIKDCGLQDKLRIMLGHQNGMTAMLLTISLELTGVGPQNGGLFSITLPAILWIALFYLSSNSLLDSWIYHPTRISSSKNIKSSSKNTGSANKLIK